MKFDQDVEFMDRDRLKAEVCTLRANIRKVRDQWHGDDRCYLDLFSLFKILPEGFDCPASDTEVQIGNCIKFIAKSRQPGVEYISPQRRIEELEELVIKLKGELSTNRGTT